tara:strand:+ start:1740 stop:2324 length:585 start_codon:yes stop_codon:yes gene_type:complete
MSIIGDINRNLALKKASNDGNEVLPQEKIFKDAQQSFRYFLKVRGIDVAYISQVARPSYTIETEPHRLLNHFFNFPTGIKWEPITFTVREIFVHEAFERTVGDVMMAKLTNQAYDQPDQTNGAFLKDISKQALVDSLGPISIQVMNPVGKVYEEWVLHGAFVSMVKPSELQYEQSSLTNISVTVTYDYAELKRF